jgi:hypothetical protein
LDIIKNWDKLKSQIHKKLFFESDSNLLSIKMMNVRLGSGDWAIKKFLDTAENLCDEMLQKVFNTKNVDNLPFEFIEHEDYGELKFRDQKLFEATLAILQSIFLKDIVKDFIQGDRTTMDNLVNELKQLINSDNT